MLVGCDVRARRASWERRGDRKAPEIARICARFGDSSLGWHWSDGLFRRQEFDDTIRLLFERRHRSHATYASRRRTADGYSYAAI